MCDLVGPRRRALTASGTPATPRRSPRGETLADALRRLLAGYLVGNADELSGYGTEYRATPKDADSTLTVEGITGRFEEVRRLYPPKHWHLEERTVSPYRASSLRSA